VVACSALKRAYRDSPDGRPSERALVYLKGDRETVGARLGSRDGHFMPASLLASQFATLEEPSADETPDRRVDRAPPRRSSSDRYFTVTQR
jgi:carbohydrate kinase (thermoresistant glucokinase family)